MITVNNGMRYLYCKRGRNLPLISVYFPKVIILMILLSPLLVLEEKCSKCSHGTHETLNTFWGKISRGTIPSYASIYFTICSAKLPILASSGQFLSKKVKLPIQYSPSHNSILSEVLQNIFFIIFPLDHIIFYHTTVSQPPQFPGSNPLTFWIHLHIIIIYADKLLRTSDRPIIRACTGFDGGLEVWEAIRSGTLR